MAAKAPSPSPRQVERARPCVERVMDPVRVVTARRPTANRLPSRAPRPHASRACRGLPLLAQAPAVGGRSPPLTSCTAPEQLMRPTGNACPAKTCRQDQHYLCRLRPALPGHTKNCFAWVRWELHCLAPPPVQAVPAKTVRPALPGRADSALRTILPGPAKACSACTGWVGRDLLTQMSGRGRGTGVTG